MLASSSRPTPSTPTDTGVRELNELWDTDEDISVLNLSARNIGAGEAEALGIALRASLSITSVDCSLNAQLGDEGVGFLVPALRTDGTGISTIRVLSLMRCGIGDSGEEISCTVAASLTAQRKKSNRVLQCFVLLLRTRKCQIRLALCSMAL